MELQKEKIGNGAKIIFERIGVENFTKQMTEINPWVQKVREN